MSSLNRLTTKPPVAPVAPLSNPAIARAEAAAEKQRQESEQFKRHVVVGSIFASFLLVYTSVKDYLTNRHTENNLEITLTAAGLKKTTPPEPSHGTIATFSPQASVVPPQELVGQVVVPLEPQHKPIMTKITEFFSRQEPSTPSSEKITPPAPVVTETLKPTPIAEKVVTSCSGDAIELDKYIEEHPYSVLTKSVSALTRSAKTALADALLEKPATSENDSSIEPAPELKPPVSQEEPAQKVDSFFDRIYQAFQSPQPEPNLSHDPVYQDMESYRNDEAEFPRIGPPPMPTTDSDAELNKPLSHDPVIEELTLNEIPEFLPLEAPLQAPESQDSSIEEIPLNETPEFLFSEEETARETHPEETPNFLDAIDAEPTASNNRFTFDAIAQNLNSTMTVMGHPISVKTTLVAVVIISTVGFIVTKYVAPKIQSWIYKNETNTEK